MGPVATTAVVAGGTYLATSAAGGSSLLGGGTIQGEFWYVDAVKSLRRRLGPASATSARQIYTHGIAKAIGEVGKSLNDPELPAPQTYGELLRIAGGWVDGIKDGPGTIGSGAKLSDAFNTAFHAMKNRRDSAQGGVSMLGAAATATQTLTRDIWQAASTLSAELDAGRDTEMFTERSSTDQLADVVLWPVRKAGEALGDAAGAVFNGAIEPLLHVILIAGVAFVAYKALT